MRPRGDVVVRLDPDTASLRDDSPHCLQPGVERRYELNFQIGEGEPCE